MKRLTDWPYVTENYVCYCLDSMIEEVVLFFEKEDKIIFFDSKWGMTDILKDCGIFKSKTQARKNNCDIVIPDGFSCFEVGKRKLLIFILNEYEHWNENNSIID